ncbi:PTS IIA-like nitrogen regulatory protein PtsN [Marinobacter lutaoensis]|jgi:PTS system nitrogen regulatory IIA component|uniref:PTS IIA-like nitrogen-regulatory protein PtsN n=1 Tax=Marinobacter lutaoensis TaxID=135739 RepID=A0A1V2DWZ1_9GAMM|nr:PTS IIA-like nitrogen regulatory protein PtsN [Marinobacter lutaoensis]MBE02635.1 PTS IIA-like nitrogen-regulatory protein PtsN [Marinobacter sp.]MBI43262.1 PTS IIA-like nitrogen-regulatory protein PtsN [Oceanospirillales bacterium]NVD34957.1 PTS IIA-like nitrogen regulatory protein PtsN [Marinobacter lutaoensis]ONF44989.1 PTS IIA-like nitrogen-regulatory protein PtsN [Marinobacter lutaoensis]|tara:strand:+ start:6133 stop:6603 length:471 start_codon:yes stop_codon:yes gene_type:complete
MSDTSLTIDNILVPELTLCRVPASSKKRVLEFIAEQIHQYDNSLSETQIFNNLIARERLGSTGIGQGIAIPHCRLEGLEHVVGVLMTLVESIEFDAIDNQPVDLVFALIVPKEATSEHLELLSQLAEKFNERSFCDQLRDCDSARTLYQRMTASSE